MTWLWPLRRTVTRAGTLFGIIFLVSIMDTFVCGHLTRKNDIRALAGTHQPVSGNLNQPVRRMADMVYQFDHPGLQLTLQEVKGRFWRGMLKVAANTAKGIYTLQAFGGKADNPATAATFRITVYPSMAAMNAGYPSLIRRTLGIAPWWPALAALPLLLASLALSFYLATVRERLLNQQGLSPIVKLARRRDHWEVAATATQPCPPAVGDSLEVVDRNRQPVAKMTVTSITDELIFGKVDPAARIKPDGYLRVN